MYQRLTVLVQYKTYRKFKEVCAKHNISMSDVLNDAILSFLSAIETPPAPTNEDSH